MCPLLWKSHVNVKFLNSIGNLTAYHVSLNKEILCKCLNSIGNLTACHMSLNKEISVKFLISVGNCTACHMSLTTGLPREIRGPRGPQGSTLNHNFSLTESKKGHYMLTMTLAVPHQLYFLIYKLATLFL